MLIRYKWGRSAIDDQVIREFIDMFERLRGIDAQFVKQCESLVRPVPMPKSFLDFLDKARRKYNRQVVKFIKDQGISGEPYDDLNLLIANPQIDDDDSVQAIVQKMIDLELFFCAERGNAYQNKICIILRFYCVLVRDWKRQGYFKKELLRGSFVELIERFEIAERTKDRFDIIEEMMDSCICNESNIAVVISNFGRYLEKEFDYIFNLLQENGIDRELKKYDFLLFLQMDGLHLAQKLREPGDQKQVLQEILNAYDERKLSIEAINFEQWKEIYKAIQLYQNEVISDDLRYVNLYLSKHVKSFYEAMLDPVNLTLWVGFYNGQIQEEQGIENPPIPAEPTQTTPTNLNYDVLWTCSRLSVEGFLNLSDQRFEEFQQNPQSMFAYLDEQLGEFLNRYQQDTDTDIPPVHPEKYKTIMNLDAKLKKLKAQDLGLRENIDAVLDLIENETAKIAHNIEKYTDSIKYIPPTLNKK